MHPWRGSISILFLSSLVVLAGSAFVKPAWADPTEIIGEGNEENLPPDFKLRARSVANRLNDAYFLYPLDLTPDGDFAVYGKHSVQDKAEQYKMAEQYAVPLFEFIVQTNSFPAELAGYQVVTFESHSTRFALMVKFPTSSSPEVSDLRVEVDPWKLRSSNGLSTWGDAGLTRELPQIVWEMKHLKEVRWETQKKTKGAHLKLKAVHEGLEYEIELKWPKGPDAAQASSVEAQIRGPVLFGAPGNLSTQAQVEPVLLVLPLKSGVRALSDCEARVQRKSLSSRRRKP